MHIAFLTPEYPHPLAKPSAGIGTSIFNLSSALIANDIKVSVFVYGQEENRIIEEGSLKLHLIPHCYYKIFNWYFNPKAIQNYLNKYIREDRIDVLEAPDWTGITAFMNLNCPLVIRLHGTDAYFCRLEKRPQKKKNFLVEKKALKDADFLISVSRFTAEETKRIFGLKRDIEVIPNMIGVNSFQSCSQKSSNTVLYFGSVIRKKGVLELVQMFNLLVEDYPEVKLKIAGSDKRDILTQESTKELFLSMATEKAKERIKFLGTLPYDEIKTEISKATVVTLPSFAEAFPMTWLEAMAMGKAVVASNIGWAPEILNDGQTGFTIDPKDHKTFKERVLMLLNDPELRGRIGRAARNKIKEDFSAEVLVSTNIAFYKKILSGK